MIAISIGASVSLVGPGTGGFPVFSVETALVREPGQHYRGIPHGVLPCPPPCNSCWTRSRSRSSPSSARCCCSKPCSPHASCRACASGGWPASPLSDRKSTRLTPVTNAHLVCRLLLEKKNNNRH